MRNRALVVDGGASLQEDLERGVVVVPHRITVGGTEFIDDGNIAAYAAFYALLRGGGATATSTPSPGSYLEAFRRTDAETILCLTIPEHWSAMHSTANLAAGMLEAEEERRRVTVIDTGTAVAGFSLVARCASYLAETTPDSAAWEAAVRSACERIRVYGALATLTYVARTGRVPALLAGISNTLGSGRLPARRGWEYWQSWSHPHRRGVDPAAGTRRCRRARPRAAVAGGLSRRRSRGSG